VSEYVSGVLGIDFGTSTTVLAKSDGTTVSTIPLDRSQTWLPSLAGKAPDRWLVGEEAETLPVDQVTRSIKNYITRGIDNIVGGQLDGVPANDVIEAILTRVAVMARRNGVDIDNSIIRMGCPAFWVGSQRRRLATIAQSAGLNVKVDHMIDEPIGAGIEWVWDRYINYNEKVRGNVLVVDYGGGTLDVALMRVDFKDEPIVTVLSARGREGAGDDLDERLLAQLTERYREQGVSAARLSETGLRSAILREARAAKVRLSELPSTDILLSQSYRDLPSLTLTRAQLEDAFEPQINASMVEVRNCIREARLRDKGAGDTAAAVKKLSNDALANDVNYVLLAGGMSVVPIVRETLQRAFPQARIDGDKLISNVTTKVARGFAREDEYHSLNLHRPGLDLVLQWDEDGVDAVQEEVLYEAFSRIYEPYQVLSDAPLRYERRFSPGPGARPLRGRIQARTVGGETLAIRVRESSNSDHDRETLLKEGIPVSMGSFAPVKLRLDVNGDIWIDGNDGETQRLHVDRWPYVRFKRDHTMIDEIEVESRSRGGLKVPYPYPHK
jgi:actin-like ATPase involved in cell morphogenesis